MAALAFKREESDEVEFVTHFLQLAREIAPLALRAPWGERVRHTTTLSPGFSVDRRNRTVIGYRCLEFFQKRRSMLHYGWRNDVRYELKPPSR